jgi:hypothetical protein
MICCFATRIGHMFALVTYPDGTPIVLAGPCWPFCIFVTVPLILAVSFAVCYLVILSDRFTVVSIFFVVVGELDVTYYSFPTILLLKEKHVFPHVVFFLYCYVYCR